MRASEIVGHGNGKRKSLKPECFYGRSIEWIEHEIAKLEIRGLQSQGDKQWMESLRFELVSRKANGKV